MADVIATIGIAKIIKDTQPKLFKHALSLSNKYEVKEKIKLFSPMLYTSGIYNAKFSCTKLVTVLGGHPDYSNSAILFNLEQDPSLLVELDEDELKKRLFTKGKNRLQTQVLAFNKSPMFTYEEKRINNPQLLDQMQIDKVKCMQHLNYILENKEIIKKNIEFIYKKDSDREPTTDADQSLYDNFISNEDREICYQIQHLSLEQMSFFRPNFEDRKLAKLFLNFKARNYPETLTKDEKEDWFEIVQSRVQSGENGYLSFEQFNKSLNKLKKADTKKKKLWHELEEYANRLV